MSTLLADQLASRHRREDRWLWRRIEMTRTIFVGLVLSSCVIGCGSQIIQRPTIQKYTLSQKERIAHLSAAQNIDIFDLRPDENSVLFDGRFYQVSIDIAMSAGIPLDTEYLVEANFSDVPSGPFIIREISHGDASVDLFARLMWSVPARGNDERIQVNLYRVLHSDTGKTTFMIREKSILRQYEVRCDPDSYFILRFLRRVFGSCHD